MGTDVPGGCIGPERVDCEEDFVCYAEFPKLNAVHKIKHWIYDRPDSCRRGGGTSSKVRNVNVADKVSLDSLLFWTWTSCLFCQVCG